MLLLTACAVNSGVCGWLIQRMRGRPAAKRILILSLGVSLGLLFVFRYLGFFWEEFRAATGLPVPLVKLVCPVGIGFYTLQGAAYVLGVWRGTVSPRKGGLSVALYLMGFPWVLAGPMMPYASLAAQLDRRTCTLTKGAEGLRRLVVGLGKSAFWPRRCGASARVSRKGRSGPWPSAGSMPWRWCWPCTLTSPGTPTWPWGWESCWALTWRRISAGPWPPGR
ncbi:MAG: hypothetical protein ACLUHN_02540 [Evtepia gabavorous]